MNWTITVKPTDAGLTQWDWVAVRADGENVRHGGGWPTWEEALQEAQKITDLFEQNAGQVDQATQVHEYTPVGVVIPEPEVPA